MVGSYYSFSCSILSIRKDRKTPRTIDQSVDGKLHDRNTEESWALLEDLALYDNKSWNDPRDFGKPIKAISLPQDVPSKSDRRLIELEYQVQCLMESYIAPIQPTQVNKITYSCEICSGPHDTQYCMVNLEQAFVDYASSYTDEAGGKVIQRISAKSSQENAYSQFPIRRIHHLPYADSTCLGLRMMSRLSLKNDMPLRDKKSLH
ncbi:hypothetical protein Tco_1303808 [Tanacetum coccineum]